ncbi:MAG TPA: ABC transporter permease [Actinomycetes bacterium]
MSQAVARPVERPAAAVEGRGPRRRGQSRLIARLLAAYTWFMIFYLAAPILVMIAFGFNDTHSRVNLRWQGFTFKWYGKLFDIPDLSQALRNSLLIALVTTIVSTVLGTMMGLAMGRYRFRGQGATDLLLFANIAAPELVLGASLLTLFITVQFQRGFVTILLAHVMFTIAYVAVTVRARLAGFDRTLEEAAQDLGADPWQTFRKVTLPLIFPGIMAGALLSFALSIDDFVITNFNSGQTQTFPIWVFGATRVGVPPQVNVMGTLIFLGGVTLAVIQALAARRRTLD